jgi:hypothetical protein
MCKFQQAVGQRTFSMVNMCNDAKISDVLHLPKNSLKKRRKGNKKEGIKLYFKQCL